VSSNIHVDANVILRFLRNDDPKQSPQAARLFQSAQSDETLNLHVSAVTLMEVFYVLVRPYRLPRAQAATLLRDLLETGVLQCPEVRTIQDTLSRITSQKISFGDAYLAATAARVVDATVASFDEGLAQFRGISLHQWR
jgi:predicted nucleic acid-binding protein